MEDHREGQKPNAGETRHGFLTVFLAGIQAKKSELTGIVKSTKKNGKRGRNESRKEVSKLAANINWSNLRKSPANEVGTCTLAINTQSPYYYYNNYESSRTILVIHAINVCY